MDKNAKTLLGVGILGGAAYLLLNRTQTTDQTGNSGGFTEGGGSTLAGTPDSGAIFNLAAPSGTIPPTQDNNQVPMASKKAVVAGSAEAASADINEKLYNALGIGDATRAQGNLLLFNVPRSSGVGLAIEKYTAQNYPASYVNYASGEIGFLPADSSKKAQNAASGAAGQSAAPSSSGGGSYVSAAPKMQYVSKAPVLYVPNSPVKPAPITLKNLGKLTAK